jgi:hypothetical protein
MMRPTLSVPVSLIFIVVGVALMYYILHSHGWNLTGDIPVAGVFRTLPLLSRALVVVGLIATAWGTGALVSGLTRQE